MLAGARTVCYHAKGNFKNRSVPGRLSKSPVIFKSLKSYAVSFICDHSFIIYRRWPLSVRYVTTQKEILKIVQCLGDYQIRRWFSSRWNRTISGFWLAVHGKPVLFWKGISGLKFPCFRFMHANGTGPFEFRAVPILLRKLPNIS